MTSSLTLHQLRRRAGTLPEPKHNPGKLTFVNMLDAVVLLRDLSAAIDGRPGWGNIKPKANVDLAQSYKETNTLMLAASTSGSDQYVLDLSKVLTDVLDATQTTEGMESLIVTVGNRLAQLRKHDSVDFRAFANAIRSSKLGERFSGGANSAIQFQRIGSNVHYNEVSLASFNDFSGTNDAYLHQMMLSGLGELSYSGGQSSSISGQGRAACQVQQIATGSFAGAVIGGAIGFSFGNVPGAIAGARTGAQLGGLIGAADSFRLCPIEGTKTDTDTTPADNTIGDVSGNNSGTNSDNSNNNGASGNGTNNNSSNTGTSGNSGTNDNPEDDPHYASEDNGCTVNPEYWSHIKSDNLFEMNGTNHKLLGTMFFKASFVKEQELISHNNQLSTIPLVMTKIGEKFERKDLHLGLISKDKIWSDITNEMLNAIHQVQLQGSLNRDNRSNAEELLLNAEHNTLNSTPTVSRGDYGVSIETGAIKTGAKVELENGEIADVIEPFAVFTFDSPALQNLAGDSSVTVTGKAAINEYVDHLKFLSAMALEIDQVTNFGGQRQ